MSFRRKPIVLGALALAAVPVVAGLVYRHERNRTGNVYHPHARFIPQPTPAPVKPTKKEESHFSWPLYGYTPNHTRFFPADSDVRPPFRRVWVHDGNSLLEFPPVMSGDHIYQLADDGVLSSIHKRTGKDFWWKRLGALSASTPAIHANTVYATVLDRRKGLEEGAVVALNATTGAVRWRRDLPSQSESSPLYDHGRIFFGSQNGTVYALDASDGHVVWTYHAGGAVKASPSLQDGVLYFGDYSGHIQAVSERTGHRIWVTGSDGELLGSGNFYSTAAVRYGRVFLGNTDGRVYAYDARTGKLDWAVQTGAYVYSSPAVTNAPGLGPTVYLGSYDGYFYAINARTGAIDWRFDAGGRISGSPTVIGRIVYFADLATHTSYGLGISTGHKVFSMATGSFDPVISDGHDIFLSGYTALYDLEPLDEHKSRASPVPASKSTATTAKAAAKPGTSGNARAGSSPSPRAAAGPAQAKGARH